MVLSCLPVMGLVAFAEDTASVTVRIEAENATWNKYSKANNATFSGGAKLGNADTQNGAYFTWDEISGGHFNKNKWIYVAYYVEAPEAGTYQISVAANMKMTADCTPYAAILVNPLSGAETVSYKLFYPAIAANTTTYQISEKVDVQLIKGRNVIYMTPFTGDQAKDWANTDYIEITGAQEVTVIAPQQVTLPANVGFNANAGVQATDRLEDTVFAPH